MENVPPGIRWVGLTGAQMLLISLALEKAYPEGHGKHSEGESCNVCLLWSFFQCAGTRRELAETLGKAQ